MRAQFNPLIRTYLVLYGALVLAVSIVGLPLALIWCLGVGQWWARHYFDKLECELSPTAIRLRKGILVQVERTIPLENIQDVTFIEGPLLSFFNLSTLKFETAGQSAGQANELSLTGIIGAEQFRQEIFAAREQLRKRHGGGQESPTNTELLRFAKGIHARLVSIDSSLRALVEAQGKAGDSARRPPFSGDQ